jgi:LacI family transcriptional regulator
LGSRTTIEQTEKQLVEAMKNHRVDGMLISVAKNTRDYEHFDMLQTHGIPLVFFDRIPKKKDIHYVACNLENGMSDAVHFLVKRGHKNVALINGPQTIIASKERLESYKDALARKRIKIDANYIISTNLSTSDTYRAMKELLSLKRRPTAIITFNDYVALDAMQYAKRNGIALNDEIEFVSFANLPSAIIWKTHHSLRLNNFHTSKAPKRLTSYGNYLNIRTERTILILKKFFNQNWWCMQAKLLQLRYKID